MTKLDKIKDCRQIAATDLTLTMQANALFMHGQCLSNLGNQEPQAIANYEQAYTLDPGREDIYKRLIAILFECRHYDKIQKITAAESKLITPTDRSPRHQALTLIALVP